MSDSTAIIDSTADSTAIVITDLEATVANSLVADFATGFGPIAAKCDKLAAQTNSIKDTISGMTPSSTSILDQLLEKSMDGAFKSSAWALASDVSGQIGNMLGKCDYFGEAADKIGKFADPSKFLKSLASAATDRANQVMDTIADQFKIDFPGSTFPELGIGKALSDMASTGRAVYDKVQTELENVADAISPVIEYGKAAINVAQTELAAAAKELGKMDKLINCLAAVGGPDYAPAIDGMIGQLDCYYDKLGVFSDSALPNFGEFDVDSYLGSIGAISGNPQVIDNIKKSMNLYSKTKANTEGAIAKASDIGIKTPSALDPSAASETIKKKAEYAESASKTSYTVPGIPGKTEDKTVTIPTPEPVVAPPIVEGVPPLPEEWVALTSYVKETEVIFGTPKEETTYNKYDPGHAYFNQWISDAYAGISKVKINKPTGSLNIKLKVALTFHKFSTKVDKPIFGSDKWLLGITTAVDVFLINTVSGNFVAQNGIISIWNDNWTDEKDIPFSKEQAKPVFFKSWSVAIKSIGWKTNDVNHILN